MARLLAALLLLLALAPAARAQDYVASDNLELVGRLKESGDVAGGKVVGNHLYVTSTSHLSIYDITEAESPELVGVFTLHIGWENEEVPTNGRILGISNDIGCVAPAGASGGATCLALYDVSDPANVRWLSTTPAIGDHTMGCALDCTWFYGAQGTIVDARDPENPVVAGDWMSAVEGFDDSACHHVREIRPGVLLGACERVPLFSVLPEHGGSPERPVLLAVTDPDLEVGAHSARWPNEGRDRFMLAGGETFVKPTCDEQSAKFMTFDASRVTAPGGGFSTGATFSLLDSAGPESGVYADGRSPYFAFGCSVHWFQEHPAFRDGGLVALAEFENGTRLKQVTADGGIVEKGFFLPLGGEAGSPLWHPNGKVFYATDYGRGIDVVRYTGEDFVPPRAPAGAPPAAPRPAAAPRAGAGRFAFRVRLPWAGRLEIRDARRRVVAHARIRSRKRVRVTGVALPGRYSWRAGRSRGRFGVRDQGLELPAGRKIDLRVR